MNPLLNPSTQKFYLSKGMCYIAHRYVTESDSQWMLKTEFHCEAVVELAAMYIKYGHTWAKWRQRGGELGLYHQIHSIMQWWPKKLHNKGKKKLNSWSCMLCMFKQALDLNSLKNRRLNLKNFNCLSVQIMGDQEMKTNTLDHTSAKINVQWSSVG